MELRLGWRENMDSRRARWCEKHGVDISLHIEVVGINDKSGDQGAGPDDEGGECAGV